MDPLHLALTAVLAALWLGAVVYSRHRWPYLGCRSCHGTGKKREPVILAALCFRIERAWRPCTACSGGGKRERPRWLSLR